MPARDLRDDIQPQLPEASGKLDSADIEGTWLAIMDNTSERIRAALDSESGTVDLWVFPA